MTDTSKDDSDRPRGPKGEVLDQVERTEPTTVDEIVDAAGIWAPDSVYTWLRELEDDGYVASERGNIEDHGTTRRVWYVDPATDHPEVDE